MANHFPNLRSYSRAELRAISAVREGEQKLAETVAVADDADLEAALRHTEARFVLLGIQEDIGIRANLGVGGATACWDYSLKALMNVQSNPYLHGRELMVLGSLQFETLLQKAKDLRAEDPGELAELRKLTAEIDQAVFPLIKAIVAAGKIPLVIGGGHNNSYGNLRGSSEALGQPINCLNIDPHADYRQREGRHSGNGFSYARHEAYLQRYAIYGLHEGYNSDGMLSEMQRDVDISYVSFENLLPLSWPERQERLRHLLHYCASAPLALELDLDSLTGFPVSALNPSGFSLNEARTLISTAAALSTPVYFHICEGSPGRASHENERQLLGKSLAYLIADFIKAYPQ